MLDEAAESLEFVLVRGVSHVYLSSYLWTVYMCVGVGNGWGTYADEFLDLTLLHALLESALLGGC